MSFLLSDPELESWLQEHADNWQSLSGNEYTRLVADWARRYRFAVEQRHQHLSGHRALDLFRRNLPADVCLFSGVRIPEVANLGGPGAIGYGAQALADLDLQLARSLELIIVHRDLSWCLLLSHESGSMVHEEFWECAVPESSG